MGMKVLGSLVLVVIGVYLVIGYTGFYSFIGGVSLRPPAHSESEIINGDPPMVKYVALGDSLSDGVGVSNYRDSFPYILAKKLGKGKRVELINLARAGDRTQEVIGRQLGRAIEAKPQIVTILIGVNDIHQRVSDELFEKNYSQIVETMKKTGAKVYVCSLPYLGSDKIVRFPYNLILDWRTKQLNQIIKKVAESNGVEYVDLEKIKKSDNFYSEDLFHPSAEGYKEWLSAF